MTWSPSPDPPNSGRRIRSGVVGGLLGLLLVASATGCRTGATVRGVGSAAVPQPTSVPQSTSGTASSAAGSPDSLARLTAALHYVDPARAVFGLHDDTGASMDALKVIPSTRGYLGVYHVSTSSGFAVRLASSRDLRRWTVVSVLDGEASQPALAELSNGGYLLAVEAGTDATAGAGRRWLRFRYYTALADLVAGRTSRIFDAPHTLGGPERGAEGTPNIVSAVPSPDISHSRISVGFHYLTHGTDREAVGTLVNFSVWQTSADTDLDRALDAIGMHGKHGDRDTVPVGSASVTVIEAQPSLLGGWRICVYDPRTRSAREIAIRTPGGTSSFANPGVMYATLPDGAPGIVITLFLGVSGAAPGEAGELLYYQPIGDSSGSSSSGH